MAGKRGENSYITFRKSRQKWEARFYEINPENSKRRAKTKLFDTKE